MWIDGQDMISVACTWYILCKEYMKMEMYFIYALILCFKNYIYYKNCCQQKYVS